MHTPWLIHAAQWMRQPCAQLIRAALLVLVSALQLRAGACFAGFSGLQTLATSQPVAKASLRSRPSPTMKMALTPEACYAELAAIPTIAGGFLLHGDEASLPKVMLRRNQKDLYNDETRSHLLQLVPSPPENLVDKHGVGSPSPDPDSVQYVAQPFPSELRDVGTMVPSPDGSLLALVRARTVNGKKEQSIEIWNMDRLVLTVKANSEQHGDIYMGDVFSSFEWSPDGSSLLYVAEAPKAKDTLCWRDTHTHKHTHKHTHT